MTLFATFENDIESAMLTYLNTKRLCWQHLDIWVSLWGCEEANNLDRWLFIYTSDYDFLF